VSGAVPFAVLAVAVALDRLLAALAVALPARAGRTLAVAAGALVVGLIGTENLRSYFVTYAPHHRHSSGVEISRWVRENGAGKTAYMVGGAPRFSIHHGSIRFLTWGYDTRDIVDLEEHLRTQPLDPRSSVFIIMPGGSDLVPKLIEAVGPLRLETHRNMRGDVAFLSAVPQAAEGGEPAAPRDVERRETAAPGPAALRAPTILAAVFFAAACATFVLLFAVRPRKRRGLGWLAAALPAAAGARAQRGSWAQRRLAGPDEREGRFEPPRRLVLLLLGTILALAIGLRVHRLAELPAGFYCDEAGLGYNAASILRTGYDENGTFLPLYVWSCGVSDKNPVFIYSSMLPIALLGPTETAVRLTSAAYGVATVLALFFLGRAVMGTWVGLVAAALLAVCPWHLHFSRIAFELITFPFFVTVGVTCLVRFDQGRRTLAPAMLFLGAAVYTYAPAKLFVPLLLAGYVFVSHRVLIARRRETARAVLVLLVTLAPVLLFDLAHRDLAGAYFRRTSILSLHEPPLELVWRFFTNYATFFSPEFLLYSGGDRILRHAVLDHGELYPLFAPLLLLGLAVTLTRRDRALALPLLWVALYPVAAALMNEIPSASRGFVGSVGLCLLAAIGAGAVLRLPTQLLERRGAVLAAQLALLAAAGAAFLPQVRDYWRLYTDEYPLYSAQLYTGFQFGNGQVVRYFTAHGDQYETMVLTLRKSNQTDVFLRFYDGLARPPRPDVMPPFEHAPNMRVGWPDALDQYWGQRILFGIRPEEVAVLRDPKVLGRIVAPDGSAAFVLAEAAAVKDFVHTWRVAGPFSPDEPAVPPDVDPDSVRGTGPDGRGWRLYRKRTASVGLNDFFSVDADDSCAWAVNFVYSDSPRQVKLWAGFDDDGEVWVNGESVALHFRGEDEDALADAWTGNLALRAGRNAVLVRTCDERGDWRFYFRLSAPDGSALDDLSWEYYDRSDGR
jgi:4-amino-4-deoxy-L-arabinose transferase-like glycosyltransferase